jgi:ATP-binding cassette, subfamily B, bacterial PglK
LKPLHVTYYTKIKSLLGDDYLRIFPLLIIFIGASFLDLLGISLIAAFIQSILTPESSLIVSLFKNLDFSKKYSLLDLRLVAGFVLLFFYVLKTWFGLFVNKSMVSFSQLRQRRLANLLTVRLMELNPLKVRQKKSAYYIQNIQILTDSFSKQVLLPLFKICSDGLIILMLLLFLVVQNILAFGLIFVMVVILVYSYDRFFSKTQQAQGQISNNASQNIVQNIGEIFLGSTEIRLFGKKDFFMKKIRIQTQIFSQATAKGLTIAMAPKYAIELVLMSYIIGIYSLLSVSQNSQAEILATFGIYAFAAMRIIPLGNSLLNAVSELRLRLDTVNRLYLSTKSDDEGFVDIYSGSKEWDSKKFESLEFKGVSFNYDSGKPILDKIDFKIKSGELVALIGESGSGKSTIISLILGFLKPNSGDILLNSNSNYDNSFFQNNCSYSPQTPFCFTGSIFENVSLQNYDPKDSEKVLQSLFQSGFIDNFKESILNEEVKSGGANLSGGQMQRLALARAFFFDREILLLDEMTSSLDPSMEKSIFSTIKKMKGKKTIIVSTHRVNELEGFDRVFKVKDNRIVEIR